MKKLLGKRLLLVGLYLIIGLVLSVLGRTRVGINSLHEVGKKSMTNPELGSAFRILIDQNANELSY